MTQEDEDPFKCPEIGIWVKVIEHTIQLYKDDKIIQRELVNFRNLKVGFFYNGPFPRGKKQLEQVMDHIRESGLSSELIEQIEEGAKESEGMLIKAMDYNYSLGVRYPKNLTFRTTPSHIAFNGSPEALETAMRKEVGRLNREGYPNFYFILREEVDRTLKERRTS